MAAMGAGGNSAEGRGRVVVARGARATEALLLAEIARLAAEARANPSLLARPVRVVVPSRSLREHLAERIVTVHGSVVGIAVHTLRGLAFEILRRAAEPTPGGEALFPVVVRGEARKHPALRATLDELRDGYGVVAASVADLLDAGLEPYHAEPALDAIAAAGGAELAGAVVEVAAGALGALRDHGLEHRSAFFRRAREALERDPDATLPSRAVLVHGFADATGVQLDLLECLVRHHSASVLVDRPDEPAAPGTPSAGAAFTERLLVRMGGVAPVEVAGREAGEPQAPSLLRAPGAQAEVRAVAERIRALLDAGARPERIGVVARELPPYLHPIRVQLRRLGIPFSGAPGRQGFLGPEGRRVRALLDLLGERDLLATDRWLDALDSLEQEGEGAVRRARRADLRIGLHALGAGRLGSVADLDVRAALGGRGALPLPVRRGFSPLEGGDEADPDPDGPSAREPALVSRRRELRGALLEEAVARARACLRALGRWPDEATLATHVARLESLVEELGWSESAPGAVAARERIAALAADLGGTLRLDAEDFVLLTAGALRDVGVDSLGGAGGGVRVLSVIEARAQTFDHLFVLGLNRDLFPRRPTEDPLLPDALRAALATVLPDLPIKSRGFDEERYLFAQLCSAAPHVALSWQSVSDDGKEKTPSPLVECLVRDGGDAPDLASPLLAEPRALEAVRGRCATPASRPAFEHAVLAGLHGRRAHFEALLAEALREGQHELGGATARVDPEALARARVAILDEIEGRGRSRESGPYFGFVGRPPDDADPRRGPLFVTTLEKVARCPWQGFLERVLRLEPVPDSLERLPAAERLLLGNLLHGALERIARDAGAPSGVELAALDGSGAVDVPWPPPERLDALLGEVARRVLREEGIALPGFERLLIPVVRPLLERVRDLEWDDAGVLRGVLGVEVTGEVGLREGGRDARRVRFRADRVDLRGAGFELTDYKSGNDPSGKPTPAKGAAARWSRYLDGLAKGTWLQGAAYAFGDRREIAAGRYLFAKETIPTDAAELRVARDDAVVREKFEQAAATLLRAWDAGSFVPRLVEADGREEPRQCEWCAVSDACLRGESGARRRLLRFVERARPARETRPELERALLDVFDLARGEG